MDAIMTMNVQELMVIKLPLTKGLGEMKMVLSLDFRVMPLGDWAPGKVALAQHQHWTAAGLVVQ